MSQNRYIISNEVKIYLMRKPYVLEALEQEIINYSALARKISKDLGDVNFEGEITDYDTRPLTVSGNAQAAMNRFTISLKVKFTNSVEPDYSYEQTFSRYEDYSGDKQLSDVEDELVEKIVEQLLEDIFNRAFVNW